MDGSFGVWARLCLSVVDIELLVIGIERYTFARIN